MRLRRSKGDTVELVVDLLNIPSVHFEREVGERTGVLADHMNLRERAATANTILFTERACPHEAGDNNMNARIY